MLRLMKYSLI